MLRRLNHQVYTQYVGEVELPVYGSFEYIYFLRNTKCHVATPEWSFGPAILTRLMSRLIPSGYPGFSVPMLRLSLIIFTYPRDTRLGSLKSALAYILVPGSNIQGISSMYPGPRLLTLSSNGCLHPKPHLVNLMNQIVNTNFYNTPPQADELASLKTLLSKTHILG